MAVNLDFEKPLLELEEKISQLSQLKHSNDANLNLGIKLLQEKIEFVKELFFQNLTAMEKVALARHPLRPYPQDYVERIFKHFLELHGDRRFADDHAIFGGFAYLGKRRVMLIATRKGRNLKDNMETNFGCAHPEGYRKAMRLMRLADKARCPIVTLVDTAGAYPGIAAEERHIGEAIAVNLRDMFRLSVPIVSVITGEGGSGGALGISIANRILILENAYFSVITPEGCAAILWRNVEAIQKAAEALKITGQDLLELGVLDEVIPGPLGGAHRDYDQTAQNLGVALERHLAELCQLSAKNLQEDRYQKFRAIGNFLE